MRVSLLVTGRLLSAALAGLVLGGAVVTSCTFNPGVAGSANNTGGANPGTATGNPGTATGLPSGGAGTSGVTGGAGSNGMTGAAASTPSDGANCGAQNYGLQNVPPDMLIVLDRSGSMNQDAAGNMCDPTMGCMQKWPQMSAGIDQVVMSTQGSIRWGLKYFPDDDADMSCNGAGPPAVMIAPMNYAGVHGSLSMTLANPGGRTPTAAAVMSAATYLRGLTDPNPKYILLATDGEPNCGGGRGGGSDRAGAVAAVRAAAMAGIPVYVVGIGNVAASVDTLNMMATAGGRPKMGGTEQYYPVSNTAELVTSLTTIGMQIASCSFGLASVPPVPTNVGVYADGKKIPQDPTHANGWDYGAGMRSIELFGSYCDAVKNMTTKQLSAFYGCPGIVVP
jgi:hypothetical protein